MARTIIATTASTRAGTAQTDTAIASAGRKVSSKPIPKQTSTKPMMVAAAKANAIGRTKAIGMARRSRRRGEVSTKWWE